MSWVVLVRVNRAEQDVITVVAEFEGTMEQAEAAVYQVARSHEPSGMFTRIRRREVLRRSDGQGYYVHVRGRFESVWFTVELTERVLDTAEPQDQPKGSSQDRPPDPWLPPRP